MERRKSSPDLDQTRSISKRLGAKNVTFLAANSVYVQNFGSEIVPTSPISMTDVIIQNPPETEAFDLPILLTHPENSTNLKNKKNIKQEHIQSLTPKFQSLLQLMQEDLSYQDISSRLNVSRSTLKGYVSEIYDILGVSNRIGAVLIGIEQGYIPRSNQLKNFDFSLILKLSPGELELLAELSTGARIDNIQRSKYSKKTMLASIYKKLGLSRLQSVLAYKTFCELIGQPLLDFNGSL